MLAVKGRSKTAPRMHLLVLATMVVVLLIVTALFLPPYRDSFIGDDFVQQWRIRKLVESPDQALEVFQPDWTDWYYRPLQNLWMLVNRLVFGLESAAYYYLQVALHLISISLLFRVARGFGVNHWGALAAALLFAINVEHQLTVDWISSIGIVASTTLSLAALALFNFYLDESGRPLVLLIVMLLFLAALLFHESVILLPLIILFVWWSHPKRKDIKLSPLFRIGLCGLILLYTVIQVTRENVNLSPADSLGSDLSLSRLPSSVGEYALSIGGGWLGLNGAVERLTADLGPRSVPMALAAAVIVCAVILILIKGNRAMRLGILWAAAQAAFIFLFLWKPRPELLGGRHLYSAWVGISIAIGAALQKLVEPRVKKRRHTISLARIRWAVMLFIAVFFIFQFILVKSSQASALLLTDQIMNLEHQMKAMVPEVSRQTRVFALRFTLSPAYFAPAAAVWYQEPGLTGGDFETLKQYPYATPHFYLFDSDGDRLKNIMPELQDHVRTYFLWSSEPVQVEQIVDGRHLSLPPEGIKSDMMIGPPDDQKLATCLDSKSSDWLSLAYESHIPEGARLAVAFLALGPYGLEIALIDEDRRTAILTDYQSSQPKSAEWIDIDLALDEFEGESATILLKARPINWSQLKSVCWSNPRLIVD